MARPAPAVLRTITLLKYLARHPTDSFTLSEISRNLNMNKATVHAMLATLLEEGVLIRHPSDRAYSLGPALVGLGAAVSMTAQDAVEMALPEVVAISAELDVSCVVTTRIGWDVVILDRRDVDRPIPGYVPIGNHLEIHPPQFREFMAWANRDEVEEWIARGPARTTAANRKRHYDMLTHTRKLGYVVHTPQLADMTRLINALPQLSGTRKLQQELRKVITEMNDVLTVEAGSEASVLATAVLSPVFGPDGTVLLALAISGFPPSTTARDVARMTKRLKEGTSRVTSLIRGVEPLPDWAAGDDDAEAEAEAEAG